MARRSQYDTMDDENDPEDLESPVCSIEKGELAIREEEKVVQVKEIWERPVSIIGTELPADGSSILRLEVINARILPNEGEDLKVKRYVIYSLSVRQDSTSIDEFPVIIERRYTDFRNLYLTLKKNYPLELGNINFPSKVVVGNFSTDLIAERSFAFEAFLKHIICNPVLRESAAFLYFLQDNELGKACQFLDERRNENAIPLLENCFRLLNKIFTDRSRPVLLLLCRLVAAATSSPMPHASAERWARLALSRYDTLCDIDLLPLYIPLLHTCAHLWWQRGQDQKPITDRLTEMSKRGINIKNSQTLTQAIHKLDPRTEII